jgi:hypothetical protein
MPPMHLKLQGRGPRTLRERGQCAGDKEDVPQGGAQAKAKTYLSEYFRPKRPMYSGSLLAKPCVKSCDVESCSHCPSQYKRSRLAAFQGDGAKCKTPRRFPYSHIWEQMLDNVHKHFSFTFLLVSFFLWSTPPYLVFLLLLIIFFV